jgi:CelD/BcsL family acetyltransferase involved in cellulose biosynthesis
MFYYGRSALYYQAGWDPHSAVAGLSPGVVLMANSIRDAIADGAQYYEFLRGDEAYKSRWTKTYRKTVTVLLARSWPARRFIEVARAKDLLKRSLSSVPTQPDEAESTERAADADDRRPA